MADGADSMNQDEIDAQLRQAFEQNAGSDSSSEATDQPADTAESSGQSSGQESNLLGQDEADALLAAAGLGAAAQSSRGATDQATAKASPPKSQPSSAQSNTTDSDIQALLRQAEEAVASVDEPIESAVSGLAPYELKDLTGSPASTQKASLDLLRDVELDLRIELGRTLMHLEDVLQLRQGSVVPLDRLAGDPVDVFVNGRLVARGEILVLNDNFCVRVAELIASEESC